MFGHIPFPQYFYNFAETIEWNDLGEINGAQRQCTSSFSCDAMKWLDEGRKIVKLELELYLAELIELLPVTYMMNCFCRKVDGQKVVTTHSYL